MGCVLLGLPQLRLLDLLQHPPQGGVCSNGWYKLVAHANGPGGSAENNGAYVIHYVHGTMTAVAPLAQNASIGTLVQATLSSECKVHYTPI